MATLAAFIGFYAQQSPLADLDPGSLRFLSNPPQMYRFIVTPHLIVFVGGMVTGLVFGAFGSAWAARRSRRAAAAIAVLRGRAVRVGGVRGRRRSPHFAAYLAVVARRDCRWSDRDAGSAETVSHPLTADEGLPSWLGARLSPHRVYGSSLLLSAAASAERKTRVTLSDWWEQTVGRGSCRSRQFGRESAGPARLAVAY